MTKKQFHIIRILSDTQFVIDAGETDNIRAGNTFSIVDSNGEAIKDLDGNVIGHLGKTKGLITVSDVHEKFAVAKTEQEYTRVPISAMQSLRSSTHYQRLNIDTSEIEPLENENPIKKGDLVELQKTKE